jgi:bacteriocin-like protein
MASKPNDKAENLPKKTNKETPQASSQRDEELSEEELKKIAGGVSRDSAQDLMNSSKLFQPKI